MNGAAVSFEAPANAAQQQITRTWSAVLDRRTLFIGLSIFVGYYLGAKLGFAPTFKPHPVSVLWPPNSILVAALLLTAPRVWWVLLLAAFPAHLAAQSQSHVPPTMIFCWFISNCSEAIIGATAARLLIQDRMEFNRLRNVGVFCFCVAFLGPFLSSFLDAAFVIWNGWGEGTYREIWRIRLTSNVLAALTVAPLIVTWATSGRAFLREASGARYIEGALLFVALLLIGDVVLYKATAGEDWFLPYLPLPFLLWAAVRFGSAGASTAIGTVTFLAIWSAAHGHGPFSGGPAEQDALSIQIFLIALSVPILFLGAVIEERATREAELRESEERIRLAADAGNLGIWEWDLTRDEICATSARQALLGWPASGKITLDSFIRQLHPDDRNRVREAIDEAIHHGKDYDCEYRVVLPDGVVRWMAARGRVHLDINGQPNRLLGISTDITDRKKAELEAQQRREDLSHLSRIALVGEISASIAHELNQPLTAIASNASAARRFIKGGNADAALLLDVLNDVAADSKRAGEVIKSVRSLIQKGEGVRMPLNLNSVITDIVRLANLDIVSRECIVTTELDPQLPQIDADLVQIQQVLLNLIANGLDAMEGLPPSERRLIIMTRSNEGRGAEVSVSDFGVGLPKDNPNKIFETFFSTKEKGMGLGLSIVRSIVEAHGGAIRAENRPVGGARVIVRLPARRAEVRSATAGEGPAIKMKLSRDVLFHHDLRLMVFRPRGILDEKRVDEIVALLEREEKRAHREFDRFSDLSKLDAIRLSFQHVVRVSLHRLLSYSKHPPVKSAFYVTSDEAAQIVNIHAIMTDRSPLQVAMFRDLTAAAEWLGVSVENLRIGE